MAPFGLLALLSAVCALMVGCLISVVADCYGRGRGR